VLRTKLPIISRADVLLGLLAATEMSRGVSARYIGRIINVAGLLPLNESTTV